jgi:hypothetical protein
MELLRVMRVAAVLLPRAIKRFRNEYSLFLNQNAVAGSSVVSYLCASWLEPCAD